MRIEREKESRIEKENANCWHKTYLTYLKYLDLIIVGRAVEAAAVIAVAVVHQRLYLCRQFYGTPGMCRAIEAMALCNSRDRYAAK